MPNLELLNPTASLVEIPMPEEYPVIICGSGSAGLCAALWLTRYGIPYIILESRDGPLRVGQADGVQCRTVEIFESFGIAKDLLGEAYHVLEIAFWADGDTAETDGDTVETNGEDDHRRGSGPQHGAQRDAGIRRTHFAADTPPGLSHMPHVILNQARMNDLMIGEIRRSGGNVPPIQYSCEVRQVRVDQDTASHRYPVRVTAVKEGVEVEYRGQYVLVSGCSFMCKG